MIKTVDLRVASKFIHNEEYINALIVNELNLRIEDVSHIELVKRSIDARKNPIKYNLRFEVYVDEKFTPITSYFQAQNVSNGKQVGIIGSGPA